MYTLILLQMVVYYYYYPLSASVDVPLFIMLSDFKAKMQKIRFQRFPAPTCIWGALKYS